MKIKELAFKNDIYVYECKLTPTQAKSYILEDIIEFLKTLFSTLQENNINLFNQAKVNESLIKPIQWNKNKQPTRFIILI